MNSNNGISANKSSIAINGSKVNFGTGNTNGGARKNEPWSNTGNGISLSGSNIIISGNGVNFGTGNSIY